MKSIFTAIKFDSFTLICPCFHSLRCRTQVHSPIEPWNVPIVLMDITWKCFANNVPKNCTCERFFTRSSCISSFSFWPLSLLIHLFSQVLFNKCNTSTSSSRTPDQRTRTIGKIFTPSISIGVGWTDLFWRTFERKPGTMAMHHAISRVTSMTRPTDWLDGQRCDNCVLFQLIIRVDWRLVVRRITVLPMKNEEIFSRSGETRMSRTINRSVHRFDKPFDINPRMIPIPIITLLSIIPIAVVDISTNFGALERISAPISLNFINCNGSTNRHELWSFTSICSIPIFSCLLPFIYPWNFSPRVHCIVTHVSSRLLFRVSRSLLLVPTIIRFSLVFTSISDRICAILFVILFVYLVIQQILSVIQQRCEYLKNIWTYFDLLSVGFSSAAIGLVICKYRQVQSVRDRLQTTRGYTPISLSALLSIDDLLSFSLASLCFLTYLRCLRLCRFHRRLSLFLRAILHAGRELISFSAMFSLIFFAFVTLFYLLFISNLSSCSTIWRTAQLLFEMVLMKFDTDKLIEAQPILAPVVLTLFILLVVFVSMSMFVSIISDNFRFVRDHRQQRPDQDEQIFSFIIQKFQRWIGRYYLTRHRCGASLFSRLGQRSEAERWQRYDEQMRSKYLDPIEHFPNKIDQLLEALDRVCSLLLLTVFLSILSSALR